MTKIPIVSVTAEELEDNGYAKIVHQDDQGGVTILRDDGGFDVFQIRDDHPDWTLDTECGRLLEFCRSYE